MTYKSNYEPYVSASSQAIFNYRSDRPSQTSQSLDLRPSDELFYPLGDLYPHVVALQLQHEDEDPWCATKDFTGYQDTSYWAEIVSPSSPRSLPEHSSKRSLRRCSGEIHKGKIRFQNPSTPPPRRRATKTPAFRVIPRPALHLLLEAFLLETLMTRILPS
ncbi:uncharacterized protein BDV17DRAFT_293724 [Aspergillus undulatus]|uniref:uncharacterized protein n=1 Tax=Aspergillus undulatus TaxID=1810928 RepID=UPI003CCE0459